MLVNNKEQRQNPLNFSHSIKENLSIIHQELEHSLKKYSGLKLDDSSNSESELDMLTIDQEKDIEENIQLMKQLFMIWGKNQMKSILIYNKLIFKSKKITYHTNFIFQNTTFHQNLWPLMTFFLDNKLNHSKFIQSSSKLVDVWYQFIACEYKVLFQKIILKNLLQNQKLGEWFRKQCIQNLFQNYLNGKKTYTNFIVNYFLFGIAFLFFQSISILKKIFENESNSTDFVNENDRITRIRIIQTNYIDKFNLEEKE